MAITLVGSTSYATGTSSNVAQPIALPAGSAVGDLALLVYTQERATVPTIPAGWTTVYAVESTTTPMATFHLYKVLTADDILAGSVTVGPSATRRFATAMVVLRGAGTPTAATKALTVNGSGTTTAIGPNHTAAAATGWLVSLLSLTARQTPWVYSITPGAGWTERVEAASVSTTAVNAISHIATKAVTASGAQTGQTATVSNGDSGYFASTLYVPEASGGGTTEPPPATGTVTFVGKAEASTGAASAVSISCPLPTGAAVDQLAIAVLAQERSAAGAAVPTGWTVIENASDTTLLTSIKAYKHLTPADLAAGSVTFTTTATRRMAAAVAVFSGAGVPTWASSGYVTAGTSTTTAGHPAVTAAASTGMLASLTVLRSAVDPWIRTWAPEADWTERVDVGSASTTSVNAYVNIATQPVALAGSQPGHVLTGSDPQFGYFATSVYIPVGTAPAGAGETQIVAAGSQVVLRGTGTGPEVWSQTGSTPAGVTVQLGGDTQTATFDAPVPLEDVTLTFARGTGTATVIVRRARSRRLVSVNPQVWKPIYEERVTEVEANPPIDVPDNTRLLLPVTNLTASQPAGTRKSFLNWDDPNQTPTGLYAVSESLHGGLNTTVTTTERLSTDLAPGDYLYAIAPIDPVTGATGTAVTVAITILGTGGPTITSGTPVVGQRTWSVTQTASPAVTVLGQLKRVVDGPVVATYTLTTAGTSFTESYSGLEPGTQYIRTATFTRADNGVTTVQSGTFTTGQATATVKYERLAPVLATDASPLPADAVAAGWRKVRVLSRSTYTVDDGPTQGFSGNISLPAGTNNLVILPRAATLSRNGGFTLGGGNHLSVRGGEVNSNWMTEDWYWFRNGAPAYGQTQRKGMQFNQQTGHIEAEGLYIHGPHLNDALWVNTALTTVTEGKRYITLQNCLFTDVRAPSTDAMFGRVDEFGVNWALNTLHEDDLQLMGNGTNTVVRLYQCLFESAYQGIMDNMGEGVELEMERVHFNMTLRNTNDSQSIGYAVFLGGPVRIGPQVTVRNPQRLNGNLQQRQVGYPETAAKWAAIEQIVTTTSADPAWRAAAWAGDKTPGPGYVVS